MRTTLLKISATFLITGATLLVGLQPETTVKKVEIEATYDGHEGDYYFFTDAQERAISLTIAEEKGSKGIAEELDDNEAIGTLFIIAVNAQDDATDDYLPLIEDKDLIEVRATSKE